MDGDEEMDGFFVTKDVEFFVTDLDYEFDANCFFDFTRPETASEAELSESWFRSAGTYPPSSFVVKSKWREEMYGENANASFKSNAGESMTSSTKNSDYDMNPNTPELNGNREGAKCYDESSKSTLKTTTKQLGKSSGVRSSTLMKPTASHLAKLKPANEIYPSRSLGRSLTARTASNETSSRSSPFSIYLDATKRQKLDIGYLRKVARLKHQNLLLHKLSKVPNVVANNVNARPKSTIPKEPNLETSHRAQRYRPRNNPETDVKAKLKPSVSEARPLNRNIPKTSPMPPQKKSEQPSPMFQRSDIQISESISIDGISDVERLKYGDGSKQQKGEPANKTKVRPLSRQKFKHPVENKPSCNPPTELFKKLSLKSEIGRIANCRTNQRLNKVPKENVPSSFRQVLSVS